MTTSNLMNRFGLSNLLGFMFQGRRDMYGVFGYMKEGTIEYKHCLGKYKRQDVAARVIDAPADALWTNPPEVTTGNEAWDTAWKNLVADGMLWSVLGRLDRLAGMNPYAALLLGFDKSGALNIPLVRGSKERKLTYVQPYIAAAAEVKEFVNDPTDARFMLPKTYTIKPNLQDAAESRKKGVFGNKVFSDFEVHASRVLHVVENPLIDVVYGNPRVERIFNLLDDLLKVCGGSAEAFWLIANRGMQVDVDKEMELAPEDEEDLTDEIEEYVHGLRRVIRTRGIKITNLGSDSPSPKDVFNMLISLLSGATGIPKRILLGSEAGQLASEQDRANWAERIGERRTNFGEARVIRPLCSLLSIAGVLPDDTGLVITVKWPEAFKLSPLERAQTSAQSARSAINMAKTMTEQVDLISIEEGRSIIGFEGLSVGTKGESGIDKEKAKADMAAAAMPDTAKAAQSPAGNP